MPEFNATLVVVMISFVIFMVAMKAIYFDPILKIKDKREHKLKDDRNAAQRFIEEFERLQVDYEAGLKQARKEAHQAIQEIRQQAKTQAQKTLMEARTNAQAETDRQMADLQQWRETTYQKLDSDRESLKRAVIAKVTSTKATSDLKIRTTSGGGTP